MAVGPDQYVIYTQPQSRLLADDGEQLVMEAICDSENLIKDTSSRVFWAGIYPMVAGGLLPAVCWCAIGVPVGRCLGRRAADSWRLYLTRTALHYRKLGNLVCTCCSSPEDTGMRHVSLSDVNAIAVETNHVEGCLCCSDAKSLPTTVKIVLKPGRRHDLLPRNRPLIEICLNPYTSETSVILRLKHCVNADNFVKAVKEQMATQY